MPNLSRILNKVFFFKKKKNTENFCQLKKKKGRIACVSEWQSYWKRLVDTNKYYDVIPSMDSGSPS